MLEEADEGRDRKILAPVLLEAVKPPLGYRRIEAADLSAWDGDSSPGEFPLLIERLTSLLGPAPADTGAPTKDPDAAVVEQQTTIKARRRSTPERASKAPGESFRDRLKDGAPGPEMVIVPAGSFRMGSPDDDADGDDAERPRHEVRIRKPFAFGRYAVRFDEYDRFVEASGAGSPSDEDWGRDNRPVINVSWDDALAYIEWLSEQTGKRYRLPSEAEWEYAARAGTETRYWWGDKARQGQANFDGSGSRWSNKSTAPVDAFEPNAFGLYQMLGNTWEWAADCWHENYEGAPKDGRAWGKEDGGDCRRRVIRGGSWGGGPRGVRSAGRDGYAPGYRGGALGFRLPQDL